MDELIESRERRHSVKLLIKCYFTREITQASEIIDARFTITQKLVANHLGEQQCVINLRLNSLPYLFFFFDAFLPLPSSLSSMLIYRCWTSTRLTEGRGAQIHEKDTVGGRAAAEGETVEESRKRRAPRKLGHVARFHEIYLIKVGRANQARADTHARRRITSWKTERQHI